MKASGSFKRGIVHGGIRISPFDYQETRKTALMWLAVPILLLVAIVAYLFRGKIRAMFAGSSEPGVLTDKTTGEACKLYPSGEPVYMGCGDKTTPYAR